MVGPPSLALLYATSAHTLLAVTYERRWTDRVRPLAVRTALVLASAAAAIGARASPPRSIFLLTGSRAHPSDKAAAAAAGVAASTALLATSSAAISAFLISDTRASEVNGPRPDLTGGSMTGRVALVTGSNSGIGRETARSLLGEGATVVMACRNEGRAREAMEDLIASVEEAGRAGDTGADPTAASDPPPPPTPPRDRLLFLPLDLSDLSSVRSAAARFGDMALPLHVLVNNAGMMNSDRHVTVDGFELTMAANHLGHFLLTSLLLPHLREAQDRDLQDRDLRGSGGSGGDSSRGGGVRVVTVASSVHSMSRDGLHLEDLNCERRPYTLFGQYSQSKLANVLFGRELSRRESERSAAALPSPPSSMTRPGVASYVVHPGVVRTDVVRNMPWYLYYPNVALGWAIMSLQKTPEAGAYTSVHCATAERSVLDGGDGGGGGWSGGLYYVNSAPAALGGRARDDEVGVTRGPANASSISAAPCGSAVLCSGLFLC